MSLLSESQFRSLCDQAFRDRRQLYEFNLAAPHAETALWMILGSLFSLLSLKEDEVPAVTRPSTAAYTDAICQVLEDRRAIDFDPRSVLDQLVDKIEFDDRTST